VDNAQFRLGHHLKPATTGIRAWSSSLAKAWLAAFHSHLRVDELTVAVVVLEGSVEQVQAQRQTLVHLVHRHRGVSFGSDQGKAGYELTLAVAYLRDFALSHHVIAESFETAVPWSKLCELCQRVKKRLVEEHCARKLPGRPLVSARVTQLYETGACVYFYFAMVYIGVDRPSEVYAELEHAAREEILLSGGSLSHHHGVGQVRKSFLRGTTPPRTDFSGLLTAPEMEWRCRIKESLDPGNVFALPNGNSRVATTLPTVR